MRVCLYVCVCLLVSISRSAYVIFGGHVLQAEYESLRERQANRGVGGGGGGPSKNQNMTSQGDC